MLTGIILAGGRSERMGEDKVLLPWDGGTLLDHQVKKLKDYCSELVLVTNRPGSVPDRSELRVVTDEKPHQGPLGGIVAGLKVSVSLYNLIVAVDMPFIKSKVIELMIKEMEQFDLVIPESDRGLEPLQAVYSKNCLGAAEKHLKQDDLQIISFFDEVKVKVIDQASIARLDPHFRSFFNINTRADYEEALAFKEEVQ